MMNLNWRENATFFIGGKMPHFCVELKLAGKRLVSLLNVVPERQ
jgi:hypothetical protein